MWFDNSHSTTQVTCCVNPAVESLSSSRPSLESPLLMDGCMCSSHLIKIKVPSLAKLKQVKDLLNAFGDNIVTESDSIIQEPEIQIKFYDFRDCVKAVGVLTKLDEYKDCTVTAMNEPIIVNEINLPISASKAEAWYEVSKVGEIAYTNYEIKANRLIAWYHFFDYRCTKKMLVNPLIRYDSFVSVRERVVPHDLVCRFKTEMPPPLEHFDRNEFEKLESAYNSPILSGHTESICKSPVRAPTPEPSHFKNLPTPPLNGSNGENSLTYETYRLSPNKTGTTACQVPGSLTPPLHENVFALATKSNSPPAISCPTISSTPKPNYRSNKVDLDVIRAGSETRTTVMLRNIPNKVNLVALRRFLDETNKNTYDFLYLRMDFNNKCNVGYAFINFTHPKHIATLAKARRGKKWTQYNSVKIIDVSYANVQGRSSLIDKFRDSPIMNMDPEYRPKLYHTSGEFIGQEEPFP